MQRKLFLSCVVITVTAIAISTVFAAAWAGVLIWAPRLTPVVESTIAPPASSPTIPPLLTATTSGPRPTDAATLAPAHTLTPTPTASATLALVVPPTPQPTNTAQPYPVDTITPSPADTSAPPPQATTTPPPTAPPQPAATLTATATATRYGAGGCGGVGFCPTDPPPTITPGE